MMGNERDYERPLRQPMSAASLLGIAVAVVFSVAVWTVICAVIDGWNT